MSEQIEPPELSAETELGPMPKVSPNSDEVGRKQNGAETELDLTPKVLANEDGVSSRTP